jgi:hypothetical protein
MVRASAIALVASVFVMTSGEVCRNGHCTDSSAESSSLLQLQHKRPKTRGSQNSAQLTELLQSATQLLKSGATPDVIQFTQDLLTDLRNDILPALTNAHNSDVRLLAEAMDNFVNIESRYEEDMRAVGLLHDEMQKVRDNHNGCRHEQMGHCERAEHCETERKRLEDILVQERGQYKAVMQRIGTQYCVVEHDHTSTEFREFSASSFETYLKDGQEMIEARKAHDTQHETCKGLNEDLKASKQDCDEAKKELEHASCAVHRAQDQGWDDFNTAWSLAAKHLEETKEAVQTLQEHRIAELRGLKQIECVVEELYNRGGKPCDEDANEADEIAANCAAAGRDSSSLDITFPEAPVKREAEANDPHPCDPSFLTKEYGHLSGTCFSDMAECMPCPGDASQAEPQEFDY